MIAIALHFPGGRYHATPWGRHVNEGVAEWPPALWRFLRALVATWHRTLPQVPAAAMARLLATLADPPLVALPPGTTAHTRHYMPWFKKGPDDRALVLDTFVGFAPGQPLYLAWPEAAPGADLHGLLAALLECLPYLGRAESGCVAALAPPPPAFNCRPLAEGETAPPGWETVRVLAPAPAAPQALLAALETDTEDLRTRSRRLEPPGSRWVVYARDPNTLAPHPRPAPRVAAAPVVHAVRYALDATPLPRLTEAVDLGELARLAAMSRFARVRGGGRSPILSGRVEDGRLKGHQHAFYLPADEDGDGRLDHLTIYAPAGLPAAEQEALAGLERLWRGEGEPEIRLALLGLLSRTGLAQAHPWCRPAALWESVTPYVLTRHPKRHRDGSPKWNERGEQVDGPEDQVRREWERRRQADPALPELLALERVEACAVAGRPLRWLEFRRWRSRGGGTSTGFACGLRLRFAAPVAGPLALGYGCHFGLGQFRPAPGG